MTFIKFLFVLALAVPLAVFMWNYINKLSDEFQRNAARSKESVPVQSHSVPVKDRRKHDRRKKNRTGPVPEGASGRSAGSRQQDSAAVNAPSSAYGQQRMPEHYQELRSNFEHSKMKKQYEESLHRSSPDPKGRNTSEKRKNAQDRPALSKRKRRKQRRKEKELRDREIRR